MAAGNMKQLFWCPERRSYVNLQGQVEMIADSARLVGDGALFPIEEAAVPEGVVRVESQGETQSYRYDPYSSTSTRDLERSGSNQDNASHGVNTYGSNSDAGLSDCTSNVIDAHGASHGHPQPTPPVQPLGCDAQQQYNNASPSHSMVNHYSGTPSHSSHGSTPTATTATTPNTSPQSRTMQQGEWQPQQAPVEQVEEPHYDATTAPPPLLPSESKTFAMAMQQQGGNSPQSVCSNGMHTPPQSVDTSPHHMQMQPHQAFLPPPAPQQQQQQPYAYFPHEPQQMPMDMMPHDQHCAPVQHQTMVMACAQPVQCQAAQAPMPNHCMPPQAPPSRVALVNAEQAPQVQQQQQYYQPMECQPMECQPMECQPMDCVPQNFQRDVKVLVEFKHGRRAVCICDGDVVDLDSLPATMYNLVEGDRGHDICRVICLSSPRLHSEKVKNTTPPRVLRPASAEEVEYWETVLEDEEQGAKALVNKLIAQAKLPLTVTHASYQIDRKKLTFYYESPEHQPDFRCLLSECYAFWKCRIWFTNLPRRHYRNQHRDSHSSSNSNNSSKNYHRA
eukprot:TRINITY_DN2073_c0_g1_i1.p1 TRINITY_DN2073_c0_g1~~TRINITY_DN2073_c0_g1_i1.p1  ORF type:complete len:560 (+),score=218.30 TRINITY_DN2073_c0_g1_i1:59-1738(+)